MTVITDGFSLYRLWNKHLDNSPFSPTSFHVTLGLSRLSFTRLFFCSVLHPVHHLYSVSLFRTLQRLYSAQCGLHPRQQSFRQTQLNNIHPLNFHRVLSWPPVLFIFLFIFEAVKGGAQTQPALIYLFIFSLSLTCHAIQCVVSIMHAVLIYECTMFDCAESTQRAFCIGTRLGVWEHAAADRAASY